MIAGPNAIVASITTPIEFPLAPEIVAQIIPLTRHPDWSRDPESCMRILPD